MAELKDPTKIGGGQVNDYVIDYYPKTKEEYNLENSDGKHNWWRLYKSGWLEQGGTLSSVPTDSDYTITFNRSWLDTGYQLFIQSLGDRRDNTIYTNGTSVKTKNKNNCVINTQDYDYGRDWYAKGWSSDAFK